MNLCKIALITSESGVEHSGSWLPAWTDYCESNSLPYKIFSASSFNIIDEIRDFDILLWHFSGYSFQDMLIARSILFSAKSMGVKIFPDFEDAWHFDDKLAENYILQAAEAPLPEFYHFFKLKDLKLWLNKVDKYPFVAKLKNGSGSNNVKLINNKNEAIKYTNRMFRKGFNSAPSLIFKASSNLRSTTSLKSFISRFKRIPEFLRTMKNAKEFPNERGYVFFQEFIPNDGFDIKVVVVGNKLSYIARNVRKNDFRASGGGDLFIDNNIITKEIIDIAFRTSDKLGFQCMGYDFVVDNRTNQAKIVEISFGFSHTAQLICGGHFDRTGTWHDKPLNAPKEILSNLIYGII